MPKNKGKIKIPILVLGLAIIAFFIFIGWMRAYDTIISPTPPPDQTIASSTALGGGDASSTATSTIVIATSTTTTTTVRQPPPVPLLTILPPLLPQNIGHAAGIAGGGSLSKLSSSTLNQELDQMVVLGIKWVRFDIEWGDVQYSSPNNSTWGNYDRLINAIVAHHLRALGIIAYTPAWARAPDCRGGVECPPQDPATFATFAAEVAARYKNDGLHYWEIWNEPNNFNFWATKTDCNAYTALLKATYPAIKQVDPNAVVVTGGLAPESTNDVNISPTDFLTCVYKAGGKNYFDAVGDHPYSFPGLPSGDTAGAWAQMSETTPSLRSIMVANGDGDKKIWMTEFGAPTGGPDSHWFVSETQQIQMVTDTFQLYETYGWAGPIFWYTFKDGSNTTDTNENFFGLVRYDGSTKPAFWTLKSLISVGL